MNLNKELKVESQGKPNLQYLDEFAERMLSLIHHHLIALLEAGAVRNAYEINLPPQTKDDNESL